MLIILFSIANLKIVIAPVTDYYSTSGSYGGNWTNNAEESDSSPDDVVAWDTSSNNNEIYTYNYASLTGAGSINKIYFGLRTNFSAPTVGNDILAMKYSLDSGTTWYNLDGSAYDGSDNATQSSALTSYYNLVSASLSWTDLSDIYLGVHGIKSGLPDNEIVGIDSIWLRVNYSDNSKPHIRLMDPETNNWTLESEVTFFYNVTDQISGIQNCSVILNGKVNKTNYSVSENLPQNITIFNIDDGTYTWNINCTDNSEDYNENYSVSRIINIDSSGPIINLESPSNDFEWNTSQSALFIYNVSDTMTNISSCSLIINDSISGSSDSSIIEDNKINFTRTLGNADYTWSINCTDSNGIQGNSTTYNLNVDVHYPNISSIQIDNPIILTTGATKRVVCNASLSYAEGIASITSVNATLYDKSIGSGSADNNNNHYTNASCTQTDSDTNNANYTCSFDLWYYANNASWACNVTAIDTEGITGSNTADTTVNELYGITISPAELNYSILNMGENSTEDINITIINLGNKEMDITLQGYGLSVGDGLSMDCTTGNISVEKERYSLNQGDDYSIMYELTSNSFQVDTFNLAKQTITGVNSTKKVYWKMGMPNGVSGDCIGYVILGAVIS